MLLIQFGNTSEKIYDVFGLMVKVFPLLFSVFTDLVLVHIFTYSISWCPGILYVLSMLINSILRLKFQL